MMAHHYHHHLGSSFFLKSISNLLFPKSNQKNKKLPTEPFPFTAMRSLLWFNVDIQLILRDLKNKYCPLINLLRTGSFHPSIFVVIHSLAYQTLVHQGAVLPDLPREVHTIKSTHQITI